MILCNPVKRDCRCCGNSNSGCYYKMRDDICGISHSSIDEREDKKQLLKNKLFEKKIEVIFRLVLLASNKIV